MAGSEQRLGVAVGESRDEFELAAERLDVALERRHAHVVLALDPRHVRAARTELRGDLLLRDAAALAQLVERDLEFDGALDRLDAFAVRWAAAAQRRRRW